MRIIRIVGLLIFVAVIFTTAVYAAETNFSASSLTAKDVNCKKCHTDTPHVIHANKSVDCVNCHGDKLSVSIPQCTKCHDGPIHKVHGDKVSNQTCAYCHKNIDGVHNNLTSDAVCSHCHKSLIDVHGSNESCTKCHRSPPDIVKPLKAEGMVVVCQNCHAASSVATIHGPADNMTGCYNCHKGTSKVMGSEVPHTIHATKVECKGCHEENQQVVVPRCTRCHDIDTLHAFNKIGKLTSQSGLKCSTCHPGESNPPSTQTTQSAQSTQSGNPPSQTTNMTNTDTTEPVNTETAQEPVNTENIQNTPSGALSTPGFTGALAVVILFTGYIVIRRRS